MSSVGLYKLSLLSNFHSSLFKSCEKCWGREENIQRRDEECRENQHRIATQKYDQSEASVDQSEAY